MMPWLSLLAWLDRQEPGFRSGAIEAFQIEFLVFNDEANGLAIEGLV